MDERTSAEIWEERYAGSQVWSGNPNHALTTHVAGLQPTTALDLGCGEGADALWLAGQGWEVTGIDVSATALARADTHARALGLEAAWVQADLAQWEPSASYGLVTALFLHSPVNFPRAQIYSRAASAVAPGGVLLIVGHATFPPWSRRHQHGDHSGPTFPTVQETIEEAGLGQGWEILTAQDSPRTVTGPDGQEGVIMDAVVKARRKENS